MTNDELRQAAERIKRIRAGVEKSQDIYGVSVDESSRQTVHDAGRKIKRMMLDDERALVDFAVAYLASHPEDDGEKVDDKFIHSVQIRDSENAYYASLVETGTDTCGNALVDAVKVPSGWHVRIQECRLINPTRGQVRSLIAALKGE